MKKEIELTPEEIELLEAIRNLRNSRHNYSKLLERYARECFEKLLNF